MKSVLTLVSVVFLLAACENAELKQCEKEAGKLWKTNAITKEDNLAYWQAIERCKKKYDQ